MGTFYFLLCEFQCLEQCFHAEGNGLPLNALHSDDYKVSNYRPTTKGVHLIEWNHWNHWEIFIFPPFSPACPGPQSSPDSQLSEQRAAHGEVPRKENMGAGETRSASRTTLELVLAVQTFSLFPPRVHDRTYTAERSTVRSPSSRPTGDRTRGSELRC